MARIVTVTVSDAHQGAADESGPILGEALGAAGHEILRHERCGNDKDAIRAIVERARGACDVLFLSGGTGLGPRDVTVEVVESMLDKKLEGFGESFRRLSFDQIGARAMLSRATAGACGGTLVFVVPGSPKGARLGAELAAPVLDHGAHVARGGKH